MPEEWPLSEAEYEARRMRSQRVTVRRRACDCETCTAFNNYLLLHEDGPRPGETMEEWQQVLAEAKESVRRRFGLNMHLPG